MWSKIFDMWVVLVFFFFFCNLYLVLLMSSLFVLDESLVKYCLWFLDSQPYTSKDLDCLQNHLKASNSVWHSENVRCHRGWRSGSKFKFHYFRLKKYFKVYNYIESIFTSVCTYLEKNQIKLKMAAWCPFPFCNFKKYATECWTFLNKPHCIHHFLPQTVAGITVVEGNRHFASYCNFLQQYCTAVKDTRFCLKLYQV